MLKTTKIIKWKNDGIAYEYGAVVKQIITVGLSFLTALPEALQRFSKKLSKKLGDNHLKHYVKC